MALSLPPTCQKRGKKGSEKETQTKKGGREVIAEGERKRKGKGGEVANS